MGKQLYKVELTGWVVKDEEDSDVMDWSIDAITNDMVGFEIQATLVDASGWTHVPITTTANPMTQGRWGEGVDKPIPEMVNTTSPDEQPTVHVAMDLEEAMDIELDTKGMSL